MRSLKYFSLLLLFTLQAFGLQWQRVPVNTDARLKLVQAEATDLIWLTDQNQRLLLWQQNHLNVIASPKLNEGDILSYMVSDQRIVVSLTNKLEQSKFYELDPHSQTWIPYTGSTEVPVRYLTSTNELEWIAAGDWGRVKLITRNELVDVPNPISTHILSLARQGSSYIWLGTRNDGLYRMTSDFQFKHFIHPSLENQDVIAILTEEPERPSFVTDGGWIYQLEDSLQVLHAPESPLNLVDAELSFSGKVVALSRDGHLYEFTDQWRPLQLPTHYHMIQLSKGNDSRLYLSGTHGMVLVESESPTLQFFNYSDFASVESSSGSQSRGGFFRDINGDDLPDLFVQNTGRNQLSRLYINHGDFRFSDQSERAGLFEHPNLQRILSTDLNKDGNQDLLLLDINESDYRLTTRYEVGLTSLWWHEQVLTLEPADRNLTAFTMWDMDNNGNADLLTSYRYDETHQPGQLSRLRNQWGKLQKSEVLFPAEQSSWWSDLVPLTLQYEGNALFYLGSRWGRDMLLSLNANVESLDVREQLLPDAREVQTTGVITADLNNDGNTDLIRLSRDAGLEIFFWESGHFNFRNMTLFPDPQIQKWLLAAGQVSLGDFDNNGFLDIFLTSRPQYGERNLLFLNYRGEYFSEIAREAGVDIPVLHGVACADLDRDGDLDIYGFNDGSNPLWVNNHNRGNFLSVQLEGSRNNADGFGAELWVYPAGHIHDADKIWAYRRIDPFNHNTVAQNEAWQHVGLDTLQEIDLVVCFPNGDEAIHLGVQAGSHLVVWDRQGVFKYLAQLKWIGLRHMQNASLQLTLLAFTILLAIVLFAVPKLQTVYQASSVFTLGAIIGVVTLFWLLSYFFRNAGVIGVFIVPLGIPLIISSIPLMVIQAYRYLSRQMPREMRYDSLLEEVLVFSHGAWAQRNIQSVLLHLENLASGGEEDPEVHRHLHDRLRTLNELTLPAIKSVINLAQSCGLRGVDFTSPLEHLTEIQLGASRLLAEKPLTRPELRKLSHYIRDVQEQTRQIRHHTVAHFTINLNQVIQQIADSLISEPKMQNVQLDVDLPNTVCWGMVKSSALAAILDNAIENSLRAVKNQSRRSIIIKLNPERLHHVIEIQDSGHGIPKENWESIFQASESGDDSTGTGLFHSRELLRSVGGSIKIKESSELLGTTLMIRLQKGHYEE